MEINGILTGDLIPDPPDEIYTRGEIPPSDFGYKIKRADGEAHWEPGSEEDYRKAVAQLLGVPLGAVDTTRSKCKNIDEKRCSGSCPGGGGSCRLAYDPKEQYYYCCCF